MKESQVYSYGFVSAIPRAWLRYAVKQSFDDGDTSSEDILKSEDEREQPLGNGADNGAGDASSDDDGEGDTQQDAEATSSSRGWMVACDTGNNEDSPQTQQAAEANSSNN